MAWIKVDDQMPDHPKIEPLSDAAFRWIYRGLSYANRFLTDGTLPDVFLAKVPADVLAELTVTREGQRNPVWHQTPSGKVRIHDFRDYQPSKAEVERDRKRNRTRQAEWRAKHKTPAKRHGDTNGVSHAVTNSAPARPGPARVRTPQPPATAGGLKPRRKDREHAEQIHRAHQGYCQHDPKCGSAAACKDRIAIDLAKKRKAS